jgi:hypothetical protein
VGLYGCGEENAWALGPLDTLEGCGDVLLTYGGNDRDASSPGLPYDVGLAPWTEAENAGFSEGCGVV